MKIQTLFLIVLLALALATNTGSAQRRTTRSATSGRTGTLSLQAGIVYLQGGPQPVARVKFTLLDQSLESLLLQAGFTGQRDVRAITEYAFAVRYGPENNQSAFDAVQKAIAEHTKATVTTDFAGNAEFTPVRVGTYYVMGLTQTRGGFAIWDTKVEIGPGKNKLVLDQNNAAAAF